jgi:hypothetical protein
MTKNVAGSVDEQSWTDAFEKRSTQGFHICKPNRLLQEE